MRFRQDPVSMYNTSFVISALKTGRVDVDNARM